MLPAGRHLDLDLFAFAKPVEEGAGRQHRDVAEALAMPRVLEEERGEQEPRREIALAHRAPQGRLELATLRRQIGGR